ncbi:hypothetical protein [Mesorhizobium sp.]|uniref:hypothetical protein n=1 Tax=Mesorhizobium sp. TaxID=1871066 RepID=UPI000FE9E29D|nr:hypothetical protein [Mesorhizobium sp.]RWD79158.1 MAG: hypothetical protein EOS48_22480 [Mesorhizobium sp.]
MMIDIKTIEVLNCMYDLAHDASASTRSSIESGLCPIESKRHPMSLNPAAGNGVDQHFALKPIPDAFHELTAFTAW